MSCSLVKSRPPSLRDPEEDSRILIGRNSETLEQENNDFPNFVLNKPRSQLKGWMDGHFPRDPMEVLEIRGKFSETCFGSPGPWALLGLRPHAMAMPLDFSDVFRPDKTMSFLLYSIPLLEGQLTSWIVEA
jgi:hypothetical protein